MSCAGHNDETVDCANCHEEIPISFAGRRVKLRALEDERDNLRNRLDGMTADPLYFHRQCTKDIADARAAGYAEAIEIVKGYYAIGEHAIIARLRAAATTE